MSTFAAGRRCRTTAPYTRGVRKSATVISAGQTGPAVRDVQRRLGRLSPVPVAADGHFGEETVRAVRAFQRDRGLRADGLVGPETWRALVEAGYSLGDRLLWHSASMMRGDDVRDLQHRLNQLGFDAGPEDGIFGPLARAAVEEFQRNMGLDVDGVAGPATLGALQRLLRSHQPGGVGIRAREREALRRLSRRGLTGARVLVDPSHGGQDPGHVGPGGATEADVTWQIARRLVGRLGAQGAQALLARGPRSNPSPSARAHLANDQGVDVVVSIAVAAHPTPRAEGAASYYFGAPHFTSEAGWRLARACQEHMVASGWEPDCHIHPVTWSIVRETRMPTVVIEPGFITTPAGEQRLADPGAQERLAGALVTAVESFFSEGRQEPVPGTTPAVPLLAPAPT